MCCSMRLRLGKLQWHKGSGTVGFQAPTPARPYTLVYGLGFKSTISCPRNSNLMASQTHTVLQPKNVPSAVSGWLHLKIFGTPSMEVHATYLPQRVQVPNNYILGVCGIEIRVRTVVKYMVTRYLDFRVHTLPNFLPHTESPPKPSS